MSKSVGLECFWSNLDKHPTCPHGPTLLFGKYVDGELKQFYACSACRDGKQCTFSMEKDAKLTEAQKKTWAAKAKKALPFYNHRRLFLRLNEAIAENPEKRAYCHQCNTLVLFAERSKHVDHKMQTSLTDDQLNNPTTILKPLSDVKKEAQYLFSPKATVDITNMLVKAGAEQVLCIGAPRIHEYISQNLEHKMSSLLMDFDGRFHNFFGPLNYCWYNLFNHHFFTEEAAQTYRDFVTQNSGRNLFVVCDPPFGGRVEAISQTIKTIADQHKKWNGIKDDESQLKVFFIFPYFMESIMQQKSNPPGTDGGLKELKMADYKVDYDNHPLFVTGSSGRKHGSPVRIFTNTNLSLLELPATDGYKYCAKCKKWVSAENKHCKKCNGCTSKDGRTYKHCNVCKRCVKPTWKHCKDCQRCTLEKHTCGAKPTVTGRCFTCGESDHIEKDCPQKIEGDAESSSAKSATKRKNKTNGVEIAAKKQKTSIPENQEVAMGKNKKKKAKKEKQIAATKRVEKPTKFAAVTANTKPEEIHKSAEKIASSNGIKNAAKKKKASVSEILAVPADQIQKKTKKLKKVKKIASTEKEEIPPKRVAVKSNIKQGKINKSNGKNPLKAAKKLKKLKTTRNAT